MPSSGSESHKAHAAAGYLTAEPTSYTAPPAVRGNLTEGAPLAPPHPFRAAGLSHQRPTRFPVHKVARAVLHVYRGANITDALAATGIPRPTWYRWLQDTQQWSAGEDMSPEAQAFAARLRHAFGRAQALCGLRAQQSVYNAGKQPQGVRDWRAHHEWLKHAEGTRHRWHEYRELSIQQQGTVSHEHRMVRDLPLADVIELAGPEFEELL